MLIKQMITDYVKAVRRPGETGDITVEDIMHAGSVVFVTIKSTTSNPQSTQIELLDLLAWVYNQRGEPHD